jgi:dienelactone hydrolase
MMRLICCTIVFVCVLTSQCWAATRAYVMNGLFVGTGLAKIAARLRARGDIVEYGSYSQAGDYAADACAHRRDRIIVIGHSFGATAAVEVATKASACGARNVTMISIDPASAASVWGPARAVNFVGAFGNTVAGARNIPVPGFTHMGILESPAFQARVLSIAR